MNPVEAVGVVFGIVSVWLTVKENVWCWPTGIVNVALFILVFWEARLYADMGLQVVYVILCAYGWWAWLYGGAGHAALKVTRVPKSALAFSTVLGIAGSVALGFALRKKTDAALPYWDSTTTSFSLVAQWMMTRKWVENWVFWIAVDVVYIGIYIVKKLYLTAGLYAVFLVLALQGLVVWRRALAAEPVAAPAVAASGA